jgi:hypothetical protein
MAQQQLAIMRAGREIVPALPDRLAAQFGQHIVQWIRENPDRVREMATETTNWIRNNAPMLARSARHYGEIAQQRASQLINERASAWGQMMDEITVNFLGETSGRGFGAAQRLADRNVRPRTDYSQTQNSDIVPSLGDLIPENTQQSASQDTRMEEPGEPDNNVEMAAAKSGAGAHNVSKETPISPYPSLPYGIQETHTCILPWMGYASVTGVDHDTPIVLELRLTQPHDIIKTELTLPTASAQWTKAVNTIPFNGNTIVNGSPVPTFPNSMVAGAYVLESATWWEYYRKLYEYYTVLGCEYEIVMDNPCFERGANVLIGWDYNTHKFGESTGNITPQNQKLHYMKQWKNIEWISLYNRTIENSAAATYVLKGRYKPGMGKRNIQNDGDVTTWIKTDNGSTADAPTLTELLTLYFYKHELSWTKQVIGVTNEKVIGLNMQITMKYIVQFKDLRSMARHPNTSDTNITQTIYTDVLQVP